ncbi:MAG: DNA polymerase III subunit beta [Capsulimonadaceae bacterium]|nr:DNA polymerase III subunit beta [Capsulimonadaceae bacterium]
MATKGGLTATTPRKDLFDGIQMVGKAVSTRTTLPILTHVLIKKDAETGKISITGTDLNMWIEHTLPTAANAALGGLGVGGAATAPARNLTELLSAMPEANVELHAEGSDGPSYALHLRCNKANYKLLGLAPDEFPPVPQLRADTTFKVKRSDLREAVKQTLFAVSADESRPILTGILLSYSAGILRTVATDTHRLAVREIETIDGNGPDTHGVAPSSAMSEILRMASGDDGFVTVTICDNQIQFRVDDEKTGAGTTLITRLIEGQFPSYERVIPQAWDKRLTIEREALLQAIRRAAIVAREGSANRVILRSSKEDGEDTLTITAQSGNIGDALEQIEIARDADEPDVEIAFNAKYLIDVLSVLDCAGLYLELTESLRPGVVRPTESTDYFCVLMPMQVV